MARWSMGRRPRSNSRGQILPLFVIFLTAMLLMMSLVLDASSALLMRRGYQSAADAAALAAANAPGFQNNGCAASLGSATTAAKVSVAANLPGYDLTKLDKDVTCPAVTGYTDIAVQVSLSGTAPGFFSQVAGISAFAVGTSATAINGPITPGHYSVTLLDPTGCPSFSFAGSPIALFDGSLYVDSSCSTGSQPAIYAGGNGGKIKFAPGARAYVVGTVSDDHYAFQDSFGQPLPPTRVPSPTKDPFDTLPIPAVPAGIGSSTPCTGGIGDVYSPGLYSGGLEVKGTAFLKPGIYYMQHKNGGGQYTGGLEVDAGGALYSVSSSFDTTKCFTDPTQWPTYCPMTGTDCGVMIVNAAGDLKKDPIQVTGNATFMVRPYQPSLLVPTGRTEYTNFLLWQLGSPYKQPDVSLQGGGNVYMSGGVYAPKATVSMGGGAGGAGGNVTIQFISWDLVLQGSPTFDFNYNSDAFPRPMGYGLVQ